MVSVLYGETWTRKGISLLWDPAEVGKVAELEDILSVRQYMNFYRTEWPDELPSITGDAMIIAGLDSILEILAPDELVKWFETEFYPTLLSFQNMYEGQCALIFWLPQAQKRLELKADGIYYWNCGGQYQGVQIPLSSCLWNGAAIDAKLIATSQKVHDIRDKSCIGLYHPRIS
ncbi:MULTISPECIES: hypothetical protein [Bacillus cereus group]|uniref:hypothetical protein n=1 Tax=Bacillus cereus group TaxID=86661 RepID=UPI00027C0FFE|nr:MULTISPECIES: hypothetical protein [Bacillus cereus group]EJV56406.1 hypothetical protein IEM_05288 [Bacillus cereus BAG6O-2]